MSSLKEEAIAEHVQAILKILELPYKGPSMKDTPKRVAKMYVQELFKGLDEKNRPKITVFPNEGGYDQVLLECNVQVNSVCEHHLVPFIGVCHIAYIPGEQIIGLSKFHRLVDFIASRPQVQERLTTEIATELHKYLKVDDVAVVVEAAHLCCTIRGVKDPNSSTVTSYLGGRFKDAGLRQELFSLIGQRTNRVNRP